MIASSIGFMDGIRLWSCCLRVTASDRQMGERSRHKVMITMSCNAKLTRLNHILGNCTKWPHCTTVKLSELRKASIPQVCITAFTACYIAFAASPFDGRKHHYNATSPTPPNRTPNIPINHPQSTHLSSAPLPLLHTSLPASSASSILLLLPTTLRPTRAPRLRAPSSTNKLLPQPRPRLLQVLHARLSDHANDAVGMAALRSGGGAGSQGCRGRESEGGSQVVGRGEGESST
jgi:hypothetical protein